jgi:HlyD family secretion protein
MDAATTMDMQTHVAKTCRRREETRTRPPARRRWLKRGLGIALGLALCALLALAWLPEPVSVETAKAARTPLRVTVDEDGRTRVKNRFVVSAPLSGNLARQELKAGDRVTRGAAVARIVPLSSPLLDYRSRESAEAKVAASTAARDQARAQVERARAALNYAEQDVERQRRLRAKGAITQNELDRLELNVRTLTAELSATEFGARVAESDLKMASAALVRFRNGGQADAHEQLEIGSPIDGRVLKINQANEGVVQSGTALLELGDPHELEVVVAVLTTDAQTIEPGARVILDRPESEPLRGRVRSLEPSAFTRVSALGIEEQRLNIIVDIESPPSEWAALGDGYRVAAHTVIWEAADVLTVPASAVFRRGDDWAVFAVDGEVARLQKLELGKRDSLRVQVVSGLRADQRVVLHPSDQVVDGARIEEAPAPAK